MRHEFCFTCFLADDQKEKALEREKIRIPYEICGKTSNSWTAQ